MIVWIEKPLVLLLHDRQLAEHGGMPGVRDNGLLESALARPQQLYAYGEPPPDLADLAASLAHGLAKNHAFVDGNKRTAFVSYRSFLALNHAELQANADEKYTTILALAESRMSEAAFADWLRSRLHLNAGDANLQEPRSRYAVTQKNASKKLVRTRTG
ncbi:MAG: type toxin-antitoxin system death-on-curing family toxin [Hydrocarboniphaga sp.]|uniref:type II toxin-antitoxin system death-on-curing family toxin n=1 Tax=Hydrocarboniphaga sp. TaxID=2033016 RepID=UPI0026171DF2|nr:type II toxin-antitoxin system death-on-curing family toxin [Hydrocarboniphaga sp.]MDB5973068.1 type toxin-antitoxin system death-on-curing family toxin [Hydrocarboniphaga sp.]